jgi:hypothetical protein
MPQKVKGDAGRQIGTEVYGSRDCRDETRTVNDPRSDDADVRLARLGPPIAASASTAAS